MRGKRSKQYRKLMQQYGLHFGFREPYQVIVDAEILQDAARFKMDFVGGLSKALHGEIKPMITQCCIRHLYAAEAKDSIIIQHAKAFERRRCNHHELEKPLSTLECITSVVDPKGSKTNKHRYVVACQDQKLRAYLRTIPGVPLIYLKRSVMIMEPMAGATEDMRDRDERAKFRSGLKGKRNPGGQDTKANGEQQRQPDANGEEGLGSQGLGPALQLAAQSESSSAKKKRKRGPSGPNPLSMKKPKKASRQSDVLSSKSVNRPTEMAKEVKVDDDKESTALDRDIADEESRRKRKRRHKGARGNSPEPRTMLDATTVNEE